MTHDDDTPHSGFVGLVPVTVVQALERELNVCESERRRLVKEVIVARKLIAALSDETPTESAMGDVTRLRQELEQLQKESMAANLGVVA